MLRAALIMMLSSFVLCSSALADTLILSGTLVNDGLLAKTLSFNATSGEFTGASFDVSQSWSTYSFDPSPTSQFSPKLGVFLGEFSDGLGNILNLDLTGANLIGYVRGLVCSQTTVCQGAQETYSGGLTLDSAYTYAIHSGLAMLTIPVAPEPPSYLLMSTGALGLIAMAWRRRRTA